MYPQLCLLMLVLQQQGISINGELPESSEPNPNITLYPSVTSAVYEGDNATFNCTSFRFDYILWTINDEPVSSEHFDIHPESHKEMKIIYSMLIVPGQMTYNNSRLSCTGVSLSRNVNQASNTGILLVQGVPGKVIGFQGSDVTDTQLKFSWSPSYHVEGIPLCCNKYSISITNDTGTQIINNNTTITDTHIIIDTHPKQLCSVYVIEISAHNNVGQGETMTIKWSLGGYFEANGASVTIAYNEGSELRLGVNVTIDGYCINKLDNITLSAQCDYVSEVLLKTNAITASRTQNTIHHNSSIVIPESHYDRSCALDVALENEVNLKGITFNTHDVQSVAVTLLQGAVCITCSFLLNSPAKGCILVLSPIGVDSNIEISTNVAINETYGCLNQLTAGRYQIRVFDWQHDGQQARDNIYSDFVDIETPVTINPNSTSSVTNESDNGLSKKVSIIVGVVIPIIVILVLIIMMMVAVIARYWVHKRQDGAKNIPKESVDGAQMPQILSVQLSQGDKVNDDQLKELENVIKNKEWLYKAGTLIGDNNYIYHYHLLYSKDSEQN